MALLDSLKEKLAKLDLDSLIKLISGESPRTIALIFSLLPPETSASLMMYLSPQDRVEVSQHITSLSSVSEIVLEALARQIERKLSSED